LSKLALRIKLPSIDLTNLIKHINEFLDQNIDNTNNTYFEYYKYFINFINKLKNIVNIYFDKKNFCHMSYIKDLEKFIRKYINKEEYLQFFTIVDYFFNHDRHLQHKIDIMTFTNASLFKLCHNTLIYIYSDWNETNISYELFKFAIYKNMDILSSLNVILYEKILKLSKPTFPITFQWIDKIAIGIVKCLEFYIGSNKIVSLSDTFINYHYDLFCKNKKIYNEMIGFNNYDLNSPSITKEEAFVYLPLPLWFNNNYGVSLPLICIQFSNLQIKLNLKKLVECIKINIEHHENIEMLQNLIIKYISNNIYSILTSNLEMTMIAEYIFLDTIERNKFAKSSHEYLITQNQEIDFNIFTNTDNSFSLDFYHCCKDIHWNLVKIFSINDIFNKSTNFYNYYIINNKINNYVNCDDINIINYYSQLLYKHKLFNLYDFIIGLAIIKNNLINDENLNIIFNNTIITYESFIKYISPINESYLYYDGVSLIGDVNAFFNYLQPFIYYNSTPIIGSNIYSFSLHPTENQPSGTSNLSRIPSFNMRLKYNPLLFDNNNNKYRLIINVTNYNILRIIGGIVGVAYSY
jgi:hypothetical protein